jgi:hypothetical protein
MTTLESRGYSNRSCVCQHTLPEQTTAADALMLESASMPAPKAVPNKVLPIDVIQFSPLEDQYPAPPANTNRQEIVPMEPGLATAPTERLNIPCNIVNRRTNSARAPPVPTAARECPFRGNRREPSRLRD